ncbi:hypothetical protein NP493_146g00011 [Ridgeia piscesae]|uniref:Negative elongation factor E n=1 Tax=Ridgeia piscesae TaxID=27915 RepID=A0AAD9P4W7_RIDPI|nr:hypothetical protein NP493_146g00011 [Ridgeia piscesae]
MRAAAKQEPVQPTKVSKKQPSEAAANATEQAKKLLKAGDTEKSAVGYQPFPPTQMSDMDDITPQQPEGRRPSMKGLYESFTSSRDRKPSGEREKERERDFERRDHSREPPKKGNTVYVRAHGITEEILRKAFSNVGNILNLTIERVKNCGFVTFEKMESADKAINEMNGTMVFGIRINVSMARRQPSFDGDSGDASGNSWSTLENMLLIYSTDLCTHLLVATSQSQKGSHRDKREMKVYDEDDIF